MTGEPARIVIRHAETSADLENLRFMLREYGEHLVCSLGSDAFSLSGLDQELDSLPTMYVILMMASVSSGSSEEKPAGCVLLKNLRLRTLEASEERACEMKRLWVRPQFRGMGIGRAMTERIILEAQRRGYSSMYLDTVPGSMEIAADMYKILGFHRIESYNESPIPGTAFFRRELSVLEERCEK